MSDLKPLTEAETTELLDWVSACQSSYHIDSTPGHRFGGLGSHLQENRDALVEYVNALISARAQPAQAGQVPSDVRADFERARADGAFSPAADCCPTWYATELRFEGWSAAIAAQGAKT